MPPSRNRTFGLAVPSSLCGFDTGGEPRAHTPIADWLEVLEGPGVDGLWVLDQVTGRMATAEPLSLLSFMAALTTRVRLGVAVLIGAARGPIALAKSITTLDWLSGGRVDLGLGLGIVNSYPAYGIDRVRGGGAGAVLDELIDIMERLWRDEAVRVDGRTWKLDGESISPLPLQRPHPPLWIGGSSDAALRRAIRFGNWIGAGRHTTAEFASTVTRLRELRAASPHAADVTVSKRVYLMIDDDPSAAERRVRDWFELFYRQPDWGPAVAVFGTPETVRAGVGELFVAGADHLLLHPLVDTFDQYQRVLSDVIAPMT